MRLLYISTHQAWPLTTGARLRDYHLARGLNQYCRVTFFEILAPQDEGSLSPPEDAGFITVTGGRRKGGYPAADVLRGVVGPLPVTVLRYWSPAIAERLSRVLREDAYDAVQLESIHLFSYIRIIREAAPRATLLHDYHNIESELMFRYARNARNPLQRAVAFRTAQLLQALELKVERTCDALTVPSARERDCIVQRSRDINVHTIPNGVDTRYFDLCFNEGAAEPGERRELLFVGSMDYHANVDAVQWFVHETWPQVAARHPELRLTIVGRSPGPEVRALASDRITITGTVDDVRPFYSNALAVVVPLRVGSGTRLKILEAMAAGAPVISTTLGAEGIDAAPGDMLLADTPAEMAGAVEQIVCRPDLRMRMRTSARRLVELRYDWSIAAEQLFSIYQSLTKPVLTP